MKVGVPFLPPTGFKMQSVLDHISEWTKDNLMELNELKSNYIVFSRSKEEFNTRLNLNNNPLERKSAVKILGIWLAEDLSWELNTKQICMKAFSKVPKLSKLKYAGIGRDDLILIYNF